MSLPDTLTGSLPEAWIEPDWHLPVGVRAACSTRRGGQSTGAYDSLNLGDHVGDDPVAVHANRAQAQRALGARPVFMQQVHGAQAARLSAATPDGVTADACVTTERGVACTIMVADCLPLLFAHDSGQAVAAAHAGWRGLAGGVIESALSALAREMGQPVGLAAARTRVWLGPCIGPRAFEVGDEVKAAFEADDAGASACFAPHAAGAAGKWLGDLQGLARQRLSALGVASVHGNDGSDDWCTVRQASRFFSHRRDRVSGRFAAFIWRD
ncbi:peptidoglycan editing factor PgeF [Variovorax sp. VNK109]|uniref:peptidoglycan editing factor PgeF n=1 Tax=Variovorax sp. VNK109 TaxID=3400919 RepID=UPI003C11F9C4